MPNILLTVPHHKQLNTGDCLAACAAMVLSYLNISVAYHRLLRLLDVKPYGTPGSHLNNLTRLSIQVRYTQGSMKVLDDELVRGNPCIALVRTAELPYWSYATDHAVLVVGLDDQWIYVHDPAFSKFPQKVSHAHFELAWMAFDYRYAVFWQA